MLSAVVQGASLLASWATPRCTCDCNCASSPNDRVLSILEGQLQRCGPNQLSPPVLPAAGFSGVTVCAALVIGLAVGAVFRSALAAAVESRSGSGPAGSGDLGLTGLVRAPLTPAARRALTHGGPLNGA